MKLKGLTGCSTDASVLVSNGQTIDCCRGFRRLGAVSISMPIQMRAVSQAQVLPFAPVWHECSNRTFVIPKSRSLFRIGTYISTRYLSFTVRKAGEFITRDYLSEVELTTNYTLQDLSGKLGFEGFREVRTRYNSKRYRNGIALHAAIRSEVQRFCVSSRDTGLSLCAALSNHLGNSFAGISGTLCSQRFALAGEHGRASTLDAKAFVNIKVGHETLSSISVGLPSIYGLSVSVAGSDEVIRLLFCRVLLFAEFVGNETTTPQTTQESRPSTTAEIGIIHEIACTVVQTLCKEMIFDSYDDMPQMLCRGLLQCLQIPGSKYRFLHAQVQLKPERDSALAGGTVRGHASLTIDDESASKPLPTGAPLAVSMSKSAESLTTPLKKATQSLISGSVIPEGSNRFQDEMTHGPDDARKNEGGNKDVQSGGSELLEPQGQYAFVDGDGSRKVGYHQWATFWELERKTGVTVLSLTIVWRRGYSDEVKDFSTDKLEAILRNIVDRSCSSGLQLLRDLVDQLVEALPDTPVVSLSVQRPSGNGDPRIGWHFDVSFRSSAGHMSADRRTAMSIQLPNMVDVILRCGSETSNTAERIVFRITMKTTAAELDAHLSWEALFDSVKDSVTSQLTEDVFEDYWTVAHRVAKKLVSETHLPNTEEVNVEVAQQNGEGMASHSIKKQSISSSSLEHRQLKQVALLGLGSNLGNRLANIEAACRAIDTEPGMRILSTGGLYETEPMYVKEQGHFLNSVCVIETTRSPTELLDSLQAIEQRLGRVKTVDKGPRSIDLDVLTYGEDQVDTTRLKIPHPLMGERDFVSRPLGDIPLIRYMPYTAARKVITSAPVNKASSDAMHAITPLGPEALAIRVAAQGHPTRLMSIVNMTPDSFSDGGTNSPTDQRKLMDAVRAQIAAGATIIDIGGQSSRPNAPDVTAEEEIARILPAIEAIKALPEAAEVAISVDTYRAAVAEAAVNAGAHIINDISAGQLDTDMLATVARLGCTYVMMHMRGTPATMQNEENLVYPDDVLEGIVSHLQERTEAAQRAGIRRWRIILDPGLGFSKTTKQNLYILQKLQKLRELHEKLPNYAWLIGSSRKSFIGEITGVDKPKDRVWGTAATVTAAVQGGAQIVRVHDVHEMAAVVKMADAIYRD